MGLTVFHIKAVYVIIVQPERTAFPFGLYDVQWSVVDGLVQQPVADKIDQSVG